MCPRVPVANPTVSRCNAISSPNLALGAQSDPEPPSGARLAGRFRGIVDHPRAYVLPIRSRSPRRKTICSSTRRGSASSSTRSPSPATAPDEADGPLHDRLRKGAAGEDYRGVPRVAHRREDDSIIATAVAARADCLIIGDHAHSALADGAAKARCRKKTPPAEGRRLRGDRLCQIRRRRRRPNRPRPASAVPSNARLPGSGIGVVPFTSSAPLLAVAHISPEGPDGQAGPVEVPVLKKLTT